MFYLDFTQKGSLDSVSKASDIRDEELEVTVDAENICLMVAENSMRVTELLLSELSLRARGGNVTRLRWFLELCWGT